MVMDSYSNLFELFCTEYLNELPAGIREKLGIENVESFCKRARPEFERLLQTFQNDRKTFEELVILLGKKLYKSNLSIAFVIDAINTITFKVLNFINTEYLPNELSDEFLNFLKDFPNLIALGYTEESLPEKKNLMLLKHGKREQDKVINHYRTIEEIISGNKKGVPSEKDCPFASYLERLDFQIVCRKLGSCKEAKRIHRLVHIYLELFKNYFSEKKFLAAYLVLVTIYFFLEKLAEFVSSVNTSKRNISLEDIVDYLVNEIKSEATLLVIDPSEISFVNKVFGFSAGDAIFEFLTEKLSKLVGDDKSHGIIKCSYGAVCVLSKGNNIKYKSIFQTLKKEIKERFKSYPVNIDITGFLLKFPKEINAKEEDILNTVRYAIRESKRTPSRLLILDLKDLSKSRKLQLFKNINEDLTEKFRSGNLKLALQGIYDLKAGKISHYEVLFRLTDDSGKVVPAYEFIDLIYELRLIHLLDLAVLRKIAENLEVFNGKKLFINLSPRTFKVPSALEEVKEITKNLKEKGLQFGFEITEQASIEDYDALVDFIREVEVPISIDDFGTGYSSFSQFVNLVEAVPVEFLKIDGSYTKKLLESPQAKNVVKTINSMAHSLNLKTVAEFVENEDIVKELKKLSVDYAQGYFFSKPEIVV
ncbi:EAL domain-containing protein [Phorcysia thermohydrogeniphila]|uniref:EAL domain-containing protein (Putative c-di-GMP-specific phosphodiesterase class I) n=1 Tax=Phorcysia thermohydrogeniphila TaxID=936138 RepID=A0A4R1G8P2_9BACT|nr:EAL domain-containing protein [Phorcysia thermohydrogeniphila]TCK03988.1 EAL domain-containing protein (putative c-di-GMP-specific phosphodiesterase class I) [Phorcysia thermohydrogeniphila]